MRSKVTKKTHIAIETIRAFPNNQTKFIFLLFYVSLFFRLLFQFVNNTFQL